MNPGTILCDDEFTFSDGSTGKKILVVLNDGSDGAYIVVKTTSQSHFKGNDYGCQSSDRYPNFFCPKGSCCLTKHTWIQLDQFFEFKVHEVMARHFSGYMKRIGVLPDPILEELLTCAMECEDITQRQAQILTECRRILIASANKKNNNSSLQ